MYSDRQRPDLQRFILSSWPGKDAWLNTHQKFTGLYLFATIWMIKFVSLSGFAKTDAVPSLKCEERYCKVDVSRADLREKKKTIIPISCVEERVEYRKGSDASLCS